MDDKKLNEMLPICHKVTSNVLLLIRDVLLLVFLLDLQKRRFRLARRTHWPVLVALLLFLWWSSSALGLAAVDASAW